MKAHLIVMLASLIAVGPVAAQTTADADVWRRFAEQVDVGSRVKIRVRGGERITATLVQAAPDAVIVQPVTRVPVPVQRIGYDQIVSIERDDRGIGAGKAVAIGVASGVGAFFGVMLLFIAALD